MPPKQTLLRRQQMHGEGDDSGSVLRFFFTGTFAIRPWKRRAYVVYSFFVWEHQCASETDASAETADAR